MVTFAGKTYTNGNVPASLLAPLDGDNWGTEPAMLRLDAAESWNRARADVERQTGVVLTVRGWMRTEATQIQFYLERHRLARAGESVCCYWQGRAYHFTGTAHAAPPGTSNHGWGLAVDVVDFGGVGDFDNPRRVAAIGILKRHGWTDDEGRGSIQEPWHLVYDPARDTHPTTPEDDMPTPEEIAKAVWEHKLPVPDELRKELGDKPKPARQLFASLLVRANRAEDLSRGGLLVDRQNRTKLGRVEDKVDDIPKET